MTTLLEIQKIAVDAVIYHVRRNKYVRIDQDNKISYRGKFDFGPNGEQYQIEPDGIMSVKNGTNVEVSAHLFYDLVAVLDKMHDEDIKTELCNKVITIYRDCVDKFFVNLFNNIEVVVQKQKKKDKHLADEFLRSLTVRLD